MIESLSRGSGVKVALLLGGACLAMAGCREVAGSASPGAGGERGSVWVAEHASSGGRLFLCGTIHILREQDYPLARAYEAAYEASDRLLFELPPGQGEGNELAATMQGMAKLGEGRRLRELIAEEDWQQVKAWGLKRGLPEQLLSGVSPWYVALLMVAIEYGELGAGPEFGVDRHFELRAEAEGKRGEGLETAEFQLRLFAGMTEREQREMLEQTLAELARVSEDFEEMLTAWQQGDLEGLGRLLFRDAARYPELMEAFLHRRNDEWMPKLEALAKAGERVMVLVGAGHLVGERGLVAQLRQRGYHVEHFEEWNRE